MQILSFEIFGFAKHVEKRFEFKPRGLYFFIGSNEKGKTSLVRGMVRMLFGYKKGEKKHRDLDRPWKKGAPFGGRLVLQKGEEILTIERDFEKHLVSVKAQKANKEGTTLFDNHGHPTLSAQEEVNYHLLSYLDLGDPRLFFRTTVITQRPIGSYVQGPLDSLAIPEMEGLFTGEKTDYQQGLEWLHGQYHQLSSAPLKGEKNYHRLPGLLDQLREEKRAKEEERDRQHALWSALGKAEAKAEQGEMEKEKNRLEQGELKGELENLDRFFSLQREIPKAREEWSSLCSVIKEKDMAGEKADELLEKIENRYGFFLEASPKLESLLQENWQQYIKKQTQREAQKKYLAVSVTLALLPSPLLIQDPDFWMIWGAVLFGWIFFNKLFLFPPKKKRKKSSVEENITEEELAWQWERCLLGKENPEPFIKLHHSYCQLIQEKENLLAQAKDAPREEERKIRWNLQKMEREQEKILEALPFLQVSLSEKGDGGEEFYKNKKLKLQKLQEEGEILQEKYHLGLAQARVLREQLTQSPFPLQNEIEELKEKIGHLSLQKQALQLAYTVVQEESQAFSQDSTPDLRRKIEKWAGRLSAGRISNIQFHQKHLQVSLPEKEDIGEKSLSQGTSDILYLSLRLALLEFLYPDRTFPLILDEPLLHLDQGRLERVFQALANLAQKGQIFYLTLSSHWKKYADEIIHL